jgi:hypothetical protein
MRSPALTGIRVGNEVLELSTVETAFTYADTATTLKVVAETGVITLSRSGPTFARIVEYVRQLVRTPSPGIS